MNSRVQILSTFNSANSAVDIFESGETDLTVKFTNIYDHVSTKYIKFVIDYGDGSDTETVQSIADLSKITNQTVTHTFIPSVNHITSYTVKLSGVKPDLTRDVYQLNVNIGKTNVTDYRDMKVINSYLYTTPDGINNLMLTVEMQNPRFVGNLIIPYNKDVVISAPADVVTVLPSIDTDIHLRTEMNSSIGPYQSIVTEQYRAFIIREGEAIVCVIGEEFGEQLIIHLDDTIKVTDVNGVEQVAEAILIPEFSEECPQLDGLEYQ